MDFLLDIIAIAWVALPKLKATENSKYWLIFPEIVYDRSEFASSAILRETFRKLSNPTYPNSHDQNGSCLNKWHLGTFTRY